MILPTKHVNFSQSLLGLGAFILAELHEPKTIDELWDKHREDHKRNKGYAKAKHSFDNMIKATLFLYNIGVIIEENGKIKKCG